MINRKDIEKAILLLTIFLFAAGCSAWRYLPKVQEPSQKLKIAVFIEGKTVRIISQQTYIWLIRSFSRVTSRNDKLEIVKPKALLKMLSKYKLVVPAKATVTKYEYIIPFSLQNKTRYIRIPLTFLNTKTIDYLGVLDQDKKTVRNILESEGLTHLVIAKVEDVNLAEERGPHSLCASLMIYTAHLSYEVSDILLNDSFEGTTLARHSSCSKAASEWQKDFTADFVGDEIAADIINKIVYHMNKINRSQSRPTILSIGKNNNYRKYEIRLDYIEIGQNKDVTFYLSIYNKANSMLRIEFIRRKSKYETFLKKTDSGILYRVKAINSNELTHGIRPGERKAFSLIFADPYLWLEDVNRLYGRWSINDREGIYAFDMR